MGVEVNLRLRKFLKSQGVSQKDFCKAVGLSVDTLKTTFQRGSDIKLEVLSNAAVEYPSLNMEWLITGEGEMFKTPEIGGSIALYDVDAAAGHESFDVMIEKERVAGRFVIPTFASADWMIYVRGSSMHPKYSSGDIIACKVINESRFIQWNKVHVVATREQGLLIKRLMPSEDDNCITAVSDNEKYPPFDIPKDEIYGIAIVLGAVKLE